MATAHGEALTYKSDRGVPTNTSNERTISNNLLAKKGVIGWRLKKKVIGCEVAQNLGNFILFGLILFHFYL